MNSNLCAILSPRGEICGLGRCKHCAGLDIVAGDVVEVSPPFDPSGTTGLNGVQMMFEILCLMAENVASKRG